MRVTQLRNRTLVVIAIVLLSLCNCSEDQITPVAQTQDNSQDTDFEFLNDLSVDVHCILIDTPTQVTATVRFVTPAENLLDEVLLCTVDGDGVALDTLATMLDDGSAASGDLMAGDYIYSGRSEALTFTEPERLSLKCLVAMTDTLTLTDNRVWSSTVRLDVQGTEVVFTGEPYVNPEGAFVYTSQQFLVRVGLSVADSLELQQVKVYKVDEMGDSILLRGGIFDDGDLDYHHDEIQGDGVFTGVMPSISFYRPMLSYLRVLATALSPETGQSYSAWSTIITVPVAYQISQASIFERIVAMQDTVETAYHANMEAGLTRAEAREEAVAWMQSRVDIVEAYVSPDESSLWAVYNNGFEAVLLLPDASSGPVYGGGLPQRVDRSDLALERTTGRYVPLPTNPWDRDMDDPDEVHSNMALLLSPQHSWIGNLLGESDPCDDIAIYMENAHCPSFDVDYFRDGEAGVAAFADLARYGAVCIVTHGTLAAGGQVCLLTGEEINEDTAEDYYWDLTAEDPRIALMRFEGTTYFAVKGSFLALRNRNLPNNIVTVAACQSMRTNSLRIALEDNGAGYIAGFTGPAGVSFANNLLLDFWRGLIVDRSSAGVAYASLSAYSDPLRLDSEFLAFGNENLQFGTDFQNGTFELGTLAAWRIEGDGRVISQLGEERPQDGNAMGIISTGLGYTTSTGEISQVVCIPASATMLDFEYNFFSEEFLEWCDSGYQDFFEVVIIPAVGAPAQLFHIQIDDMCDDVDPTDLTFDQGGSGDDPVGVYKTGWRLVSVDISAFAGQTCTLRFAAGDIGDSIFDSAILLDSIEIR